MFFASGQNNFGANHSIPRMRRGASSGQRNLLLNFIGAPGAFNQLLGPFGS